MPVAVRHSCPSFGWLVRVLPLLLVCLLLVCLPLESVDGAWSMPTKVSSKAGSVTFWPCSSRTHTVRSTDSSACLGAAKLIRPNWSLSPFQPCSDIRYVEPASASTLSETRSRSCFSRYRPMAPNSRTGGSFTAAPSRLFETTTASSKLSLEYPSMRRQGTGATFGLRASNEPASSSSPLVEPMTCSAGAAVVSQLCDSSSILLLPLPRATTASAETRLAQAAFFAGRTNMAAKFPAAKSPSFSPLPPYAPNFTP